MQIKYEFKVTLLKLFYPKEHWLHASYFMVALVISLFIGFIKKQCLIDKIFLHNELSIVSLAINDESYQGDIVHSHEVGKTISYFSYLSIPSP